MVPTNKSKARANALIRELDRLGAQTPELSEAIAFYRAVFPLFCEYQETVKPIHLDYPVVQRKLQAGLPLLVGEALPLDLKATQALFLNLCKVIERSTFSGKPLLGEEPNGSGHPIDIFTLWKRAMEDGHGHVLQVEATKQIRQAVERRQLNLQAVWAMLASGEWYRLEQIALGLKLDPALLRVLARHSLQPAFQQWAQALQARGQTLLWKKSVCPLCGSIPTFSEIQGKEGARYLRCGLCGGSWPYPLLQCAFCRNNNYKLLTSLKVEGEEEKYIQACDVCHTYIKTIKTFEPIPADMLPVYDLATLHLDLVADEYQYHRGMLAPS